MTSSSSSVLFRRHASRTSSRGDAPFGGGEGSVLRHHALAFQPVGESSLGGKVTSSVNSWPAIQMCCHRYVDRFCGLRSKFPTFVVK